MLLVMEFTYWPDGVRYTAAVETLRLVETSDQQGVMLSVCSRSPARQDATALCFVVSCVSTEYAVLVHT